MSYALDVTITVLESGVTITLPSQEDTQVAPSGNVVLAFESLDRDYLELLKEVAAGNVVQFRNRDNVYEVICDPGAKLVRLEYSEIQPFTPEVRQKREAVGVLEMSGYSVTRRTDSFRLTLYRADYRLERGTGEVEQVGV